MGFRRYRKLEKDGEKKTTTKEPRKCVRQKRDKKIDIKRRKRERGGEREGERERERERNVYRLLRGCVGFLAKGA